MAKETPLLWVVIAGLFIILLIAAYKSLRPPIIEEISEDSYAPFEPFENPVSDAGTAAAATTAAAPDPAANLSFCPADTKYFIDKVGDSLCCAGEVAGNRCIGDIECTFSAPKKGIRTCGEIRPQLNKQLQSNLCPTSMPNYYESSAGQRGCTASGLNQAGTAPVNATMPKCPVHGDAVKNSADPASCANLRALELMECIAADCKKSVMSLSKTTPAILSQTFVVPSDEIPRPRMCMDRASYSRYLDAKNPAWKQDPKYDLNKNVAVCDIAKKVFIEKEVIPGVNDVCS
jgi:hypothetical protein